MRTRDEHDDEDRPVEEPARFEHDAEKATDDAARPRAVMTRRISREELNEPLRAHPYWKERE